MDCCLQTFVVQRFHFAIETDFADHDEERHKIMETRLKEVEFRTRRT